MLIVVESVLFKCIDQQVALINTVITLHAKIQNLASFHFTHSYLPISHYSDIRILKDMFVYERP